MLVHTASVMHVEYARNSITDGTESIKIEYINKKETNSQMSILGGIYLKKDVKVSQSFV